LKHVNSPINFLNPQLSLKIAGTSFIGIGQKLAMARTWQEEPPLPVSFESAKPQPQKAARKEPRVSSDTSDYSTVTGPFIKLRGWEARQQEEQSLANGTSGPLLLIWEWLPLSSAQFPPFV
jgi:hypothetical protein